MVQNFSCEKDLFISSYDIYMSLSPLDNIDKNVFLNSYAKLVSFQITQSLQYIFNAIPNPISTHNYAFV